MIGLLAALLGLVMLLGAVGYTGWRMGQRPEESPAWWLGAAPPPSPRPVLVCLGDSLTQGTLGADWVGELRRRLGERAVVINAGVGGQVTWDLRQRLGAVARCRPAAVVLMAGSNDAVGALGGQWAAFYERGRPQAPSDAWFAEQYDRLVGELSGLGAAIACLTLPPLGADPIAPAAASLRRHNTVISASAARHGVDLLDVYAALVPGASRGVPFLSGPLMFLAWSVLSTVQHRILGWSWDRIAHRRGLAVTVDTIHLSDRGCDGVVALVQPWAERVLSLESAS